jgi:4-carboxymuconolactone decarboxylase
VTDRPRAATRPDRPRIPPLPETEWDDRTRDLLGRAGIPGIEAVDIFATLVRHPRLFRHWLPFGGALLTGSLPARDRELLILRTAWRCAAEYEWGQHVRLARAAGLTGEEIDRTADGPDAAGWSELDAILLRAADELHDDSCITDGTWSDLARHYGERELIEIPMLVGQYHLVAFALNSFGVQREPGVPGFGR